MERYEWCRRSTTSNSSKHFGLYFALSVSAVIHKKIGERIMAKELRFAKSLGWRAEAERVEGKGFAKAVRTWLPGSHETDQVRLDAPDVVAMLLGAAHILWCLQC